MKRKNPEELRSHRWFGKESMRTVQPPLAHGADRLGADDYRGKPVIAILNTWSEINPAIHTSGSAPRR
jgi:dihydroxy-acid dehydratase